VCPACTRTHPLPGPSLAPARRMPKPAGMTQSLSIASIQANPVVGDIAGNLELARRLTAQAAAAGADIALFPELFLIGYPPEDLVLKPAAVADCRAAVEELARETVPGGPALVIGAPWRTDAGLHNAVLVLADGAVQAVRLKHELPNYAVFDEKRVFVPGPLPGPVTVCGVPVGIPVCEDIWFPAVTGALKAAGAQLLLVPNGSPFRRTAHAERLATARARVAETGLPLVYLNQVGGQDELCFDGASFALSSSGEIVQTLPHCREALSVSTWQCGADGIWSCSEAELHEQETGLAADYAAMMLSLRDYVNKNRFPGVILGLSGGIDSALSAAVAADALGPQRVRCVMLPSRYTSQHSLDDAAACAKALGVPYETIPIEPAVEAFAAMLAPAFAGRAPDIAEENIQSRTRAVVLMALSNKFGPMVLTTGNKSEMAVGYATLYGDMCGGYNVLKDLWKMEVYALSAWRNAHVPAGALGPGGEVIPYRIIDKAPSAELRADQTDQDSLPPYPALDDMLAAFVDAEEEIEDVIARGHDPETVQRIQNLLYLAEYKRRQAPPGVKIGPRNFGRDRRYPITNRYRDRL
jgi:NAD+ synthase